MENVKELKVSNKLIKVIKGLYGTELAKQHMNRKRSEPFDPKREVKQGGRFIIVMDRIIKNTRGKTEHTHPQDEQSTLL